MKKVLSVTLTVIFIFASVQFCYAQNIATGQWTPFGIGSRVESDTMIIKSNVNGASGFVFDDIAVKPNKTYRITMDIKAYEVDALSSLVFSIGAKDNKNEWIEPPEKNFVLLQRGSYGWRKLDILCAVPRGAVKLSEMKFQLDSKTSREQAFEFKNLNIEEY